MIADLTPLPEFREALGNYLETPWGSYGTVTSKAHSKGWLDGDCTRFVMGADE